MAAQRFTLTDEEYASFFKLGRGPRTSKRVFPEGMSLQQAFMTYLTDEDIKKIYSFLDEDDANE